eukprot:gene29044-32246_t
MMAPFADDLMYEGHENDHEDEEEEDDEEYQLLQLLNGQPGNVQACMGQSGDLIQACIRGQAKDGKTNVLAGARESKSCAVQAACKVVCMPGAGTSTAAAAAAVQHCCCGAALGVREVKLLRQVKELERELKESRRSEWLAQQRCAAALNAVRSAAHARSSINCELANARRGQKSASDEYTQQRGRIESLGKFLHQERQAKEEANRKLNSSEEQVVMLQAQVESNRQQLRDMGMMLEQAGCRQDTKLSEAQQESARVKALQDEVASLQDSLGSSEHMLKAMTLDRNNLQHQVEGLKRVVEDIYSGRQGGLRTMRHDPHPGQAQIVIDPKMGKDKRSVPKKGHDTGSTSKARGSVPKERKDVGSTSKCRGSVPQEGKDAGCTSKGRGSVPKEGKNAGSTINCRGSMPKEGKDTGSTINCRGSVPKEGKDGGSTSKVRGSVPKEGKDAGSTSKVRGSVLKQGKDAVSTSKVRGSVPKEGKAPCSTSFHMGQSPPQVRFDDESAIQERGGPCLAGALQV